MKRLLPLVLLGLIACSLPINLGAISTPTAAPTPVPSVTPNTDSSSSPDAPLGTENNPLILALPPSTVQVPSVLTASKTLTALLERSTGYKFVSVLPSNELDLVSAFGVHNAHIGVLSPIGYLLASGQGYVDAAFARQQMGTVFTAHSSSRAAMVVSFLIMIQSRTRISLMPRSH